MSKPVTDSQFYRLYGYPANIDREKVITGQVLFQKNLQQTPPNDGTDRELMIIAGVVAVPKTSPIVEHLQYPVLGTFDETMFRDLTIELALNEFVDPGNLNGMGIAGILQSPIWRV